MKLFKNKKQNKGFTLVEILLVVGFIALAGIGIYTIYSKVQVSNQANTESRNLDTLRAGVKSLYGGTANFSTVSNAVVNNARVTPDSMRTAMTAGDTNIVNTFGGAVAVAPANLGGLTANGFSITYPSVPGAVCSKLVSSAGVQFNQVTVAGTIVKTFGVNTPMDVANMATSCNADNVTIIFESL
jgi:type II secretory pathway pseudopilin PulG